MKVLLTDKGFDLFFSAASVILGAFLAWLGSGAIVAAALCFFMAGGFFERAFPGGILAPANRKAKP